METRFKAEEFYTKQTVKLEDMNLNSDRWGLILLLRTCARASHVSLTHIHSDFLDISEGNGDRTTDKLVSPRQFYGNDLHGNLAELCWHCVELSLAPFHRFHFHNYAHCKRKALTFRWRKKDERNSGDSVIPTKTLHQIFFLISFFSFFRYKTQRTLQDGNQEHCAFYWENFRLGVLGIWV